MRRLSLNDGWSVRPKVHRFAELYGTTPEWTPVTLPHDALIGGVRSASANPQTAYFAGGSWEYRRGLELAALEDDEDGSRWYSGGGIYRNLWLLESGRVHLAPDRLQVDTPEIDDGRATIAVATRVRTTRSRRGRTTPSRATRRAAGS